MGHIFIRSSVDGHVGRFCVLAVVNRAAVNSEAMRLLQLRFSAWKCLKKLKMELLYDLAIPLLGRYPEKTIIP